MRIVLKHQFFIKDDEGRGERVVPSETNFRRPLNYMGGDRSDENGKVVDEGLRGGVYQNFKIFLQKL